MTIYDELAKRILILDGATGTALQKFKLDENAFRGALCINPAVQMKGNNDILNLTRPDIIRSIHDEYIGAGADIIETNTFSSNDVSQMEYQCDKYVMDMNKEGVRIAKEAAAACVSRRIFVAGSIGPTSKSLTLASDTIHSAARAIDFDIMAAAYAGQAKALIDAGVDILLVETIFDTLNAKAALYAISCVQERLHTSVPVMVSVTVNDRSGRILTGQSLEAAYTSLRHYPMLSFGLNCSFGAIELERFIEKISTIAPEYLSIYPNAGLPNEMGEYDETPQFTAECVRRMADRGLINIAGGCCGTTPAHITAIADYIKNCPPRRPPAIKFPLVVSGLENITVDATRNNFINIGERTNVAGSAKFARLIKEKNYIEAAEIARKQIDGGALIIDINMDDAMLDSTAEMETFIRLICNEPDIAKAAIMLDSSKWETILAGLKNTQGKCIVNSISLKDGEAAFLSKAATIRALGAAVVVMAFDEEGQAACFERKISIVQRAYSLLTEKNNFPPEDIIFDVNVLAIATGVAEHANYAVDFIKAVRWIKQHLPACRTSAGVSNLSFAFRGNNTVREAMHSVFLYHAILAGLDMAIVNPAMLQVYDEIDADLLKIVEDLVLNRCPDATDKLLAVAENYKNEKTEDKDTTSKWRLLPVEKRLMHALVKGITTFLAEDIAEALVCYPSPVDVIEQPLMSGMEKVGRFFAEGKMFLPQIVKSAKVMKEAVTLLQPEIERYNGSCEDIMVKRPKIVMATAKGDVHDIGKNIVNIVLACNNIDVIDLGVMVDNHTIIQAVKEHNPDFIGISGLITPSLAEMEELCKLLKNTGNRTPLLVGGATTSSVHTAVKLAPLYNYGVIHGGDASHTANIIRRLLKNKETTITDIKANQDKIRRLYYEGKQTLLPLEEARKRAPHFVFDSDSYVAGKEFCSCNIDLQQLLPFINWTPFFHFWNFKGSVASILKNNEEAVKIHHDALAMLNKVIHNNEFAAVAILRFFDAFSEHDSIVLDNGTTLPMLRQQNEKSDMLCLSDFIPQKNQGAGKIGLFALSVYDKHQNASGSDIESLLRESLCSRLTEACVEWLQQYSFGDRYGIRPAFGYPACPDHSLKKEVFDALNVEKTICLKLTESYSIIPTTSICGLFIAHTKACYFNVGNIGKDQLADYCARRGISIEEGEKRLAFKNSVSL